MSIASMCKDTIAIQSCTVTGGTMGGESRAWTTRTGLSSVRASIQRKTGGEVTQFAQRGVKVSHAVYSQTDLSASVIGDRIQDQRGKQYVVRCPAQDMGAQGRAWCLFVDELPPS
jgi:hypothetical protein